MNYVPSNGIFKELCEDAKNSDNKHILIIDEINRGNLSKIFGELIYALEYRGSASPIKLPYSHDELTIPDNLWIIGTMNSADRSIALVDYALRRRFYFVELMPQVAILNSFFSKYPPLNITADEVGRIFNKINEIISSNEKLGRHYQIGHSYFIKKNLDDVGIKRIWKYAVKPILEEYYFEDPDQIADIENEFPILKNE
jgi:5-methylcytosine-specific restriction protein B